MQTLSWYLNRLARMSPAEVAHRAGKAGQLALLRLGLSRPGPVPAPDRSRPGAVFVTAQPTVDAALYVREADRVLEGRFDLFNLRDHALGFPPEWNRDPLTSRLAPLKQGRLLDYRDERLVGNIKYLWEPSRHLHVVTLAQAWALTHDPRYAAGLRRYLQSWFEACPYPQGAHWSSSLELGIRLINWSLAWQLIGGFDSPLFAGAEGGRFRDAWLESIYRHVIDTDAHLSRHSSANNHLIGEAAGVFIAAVTWPWWPRVTAAGDRCRAVLEEQILVQNAPDGGNREQAFSYQQFVADFLLLSGLAGRAAGRDFSRAYWGRYEAMTRFVAAMLDSGNHLAMVGDADDGYVTRLDPSPSFETFVSLVATGALLFDDVALAHKARAIDDKTRWLGGADADARLAALLAKPAPTTPPRLAFPDSGYYLIGDDLGTPGEVRLLLDAGPLGFLSIAAHGHADALSFALSVGGREVLVDPGTYAYHTEPEWRRYFRSTRAHNTVEVDGEDQSVQVGNFMWTKHANARCLAHETTPGAMRFVGTHDGYTRLGQPVTHEREVRHTRRPDGIHEILVTDTLRGAGAHQLARHWHFAEDLKVQGEGDVWHTTAGGFLIKIRPLEPLEGSRLVHGGSAAEGGWVSRSFGLRVPSPTLRWQNGMQGDAVLRTLIEVGKV